MSRILTTHVGALPGPEDVWHVAEASKARREEAVAEVVAKQRAVGVDIVNEGELTKVGSWSTFMRKRLSGFEVADDQQTEEINVRALHSSVDREEFAEFYAAANARGTLFEQTGTAKQFEGSDLRARVCTAPITYVGQETIADAIAALKAGLGDHPADQAFLTTVAPASFEPGVGNAYYDSEEAFLYAIADALAVEYRAIIDAGFILQVDDAYIPALWESIGVRVGLEEYRKFVSLRMDVLNHALKGLPQDRVRYHLCWGSWHGPHVHDLPLADIIDMLLRVDAGGYLIESANVRHEHEWRVWEETGLPAGKVLIPGVVSHATTLVEHPQLVADRLVRFGKILGPENIIASTDCGLGSRCHPQIVWAKLNALSEGAALASKALFA
jgi:5-methyltetrahydropteroyltriglutamate--homocysteine methyltransferase